MKRRKFYMKGGDAIEKMATACPSDSYYRHRQLAVESAIAALGEYRIRGRGLPRLPDKFLDNPTYFLVC